MTQVLSGQIKDKCPIDQGDISVRVFNESDISEDYVSWLNNPVVVKFSNQRFIDHNIETCRQYFKEMQGVNKVFLLVEHHSVGAVGTLSIHINPNHGTADIGILIGNSEVWGKGVGQQAWNAVIQVLKSVGEIRKITAGTLSCNHAMRKIALSSGMKEEGRRLRQEIVDGEAYDIIFYGLFPDESRK